MNSKILTSNPVWENGISLIRICAGIMIMMFGKEIFDEATMNDYTKFLTDVGISSPRFMLMLAKLTELIWRCFSNSRSIYSNYSIPTNDDNVNNSMVYVRW